MMNRIGPPSREVASTSYGSMSPHHHSLHVDKLRVGRNISALHTGRISKGIAIQALTQQKRPLGERGQRADAAHEPVKTQVMKSSTDLPAYVPLSQAQEIISEAVDACSPSPPKLLRFCESGQQVKLTRLYDVHREMTDGRSSASDLLPHFLCKQLTYKHNYCMHIDAAYLTWLRHPADLYVSTSQALMMQELRILNYTANCTLVGVSILLTASQLVHSDSVASWPTLVSSLSALAQRGSHLYEYFVDVHPIATKVSNHTQGQSPAAPRPPWPVVVSGERYISGPGRNPVRQCIWERSG
jgi:hypothetical protein